MSVSKLRLAMNVTPRSNKVATWERTYVDHEATAYAVL